MSTKPLALLGLGMCLGVLCRSVFDTQTSVATAQSGQVGPTISTELDEIKSKLPDQAHAMQDVGYHFSNLWFAGQHNNWELAQFYSNETRSHLHWAVRIIPVRKDNSGADVNLTEILTALENGPLKQVADAIVAKDTEQFKVAYRSSLEACYACHKASDKPFLRLQIPEHPESAIINFDPNATWPK